MSERSGMDEICQDLAAEQGALESFVSGLDAEGWATPTAAAGWDVRETVVHVAFYDIIWIVIRSS